MKTKIILLYQKDLPALLSFADANNGMLVSLLRNDTNQLLIVFEFDTRGNIRKVRNYAKRLNGK